MSARSTRGRDALRSCRPGSRGRHQPRGRGPDAIHRDHRGRGAAEGRSPTLRDPRAGAGPVRLRRGAHRAPGCRRGRCHGPAHRRPGARGACRRPVAADAGVGCRVGRGQPLDTRHPTRRAPTLRVLRRPRRCRYHDAGGEHRGAPRQPGRGIGGAAGPRPLVGTGGHASGPRAAGHHRRPCAGPQRQPRRGPGARVRPPPPEWRLGLYVTFATR